MPTRTRFTLLLAVGLAAMTLAMVGDLGGGGAAGRGSGDPAVGSPGVESPHVPLVVTERREATNTDRPLKQRVTFLAVLSVLLCGAILARRGVVTAGRVKRPASSWWSPQAGRSPPRSFSFSTV